MSDIRGSLYRFDKQLGHDWQLTAFDNMMHRQTGASWYGLYDGRFERCNETKRTMLCEGGQMCLEGPARRTEVYLYCGPSNKFLDMEEIDRCIFRAHFETPLSCGEDYLEWVKGMSDIELSEFVAQWERVE
jgi:hypothetical protein